VTTHRFADNPYFVLGLPTTATMIEIERAGQKLQSLLGIGAASARQYTTPVGIQTRDEAKVRSAVAALRDPAQRLLHQLWAEGAVHQERDASPPAWDTGFENMRWRVACTEH
jgi:hypothetical protein